MAFNISDFLEILENSNNLQKIYKKIFVYKKYFITLFSRINYSNEYLYELVFVNYLTEILTIFYVIISLLSKNRISNIESIFDLDLKQLILCTFKNENFFIFLNNIYAIYKIRIVKFDFLNCYKIFLFGILLNNIFILLLKNITGRLNHYGSVSFIVFAKCFDLEWNTFVDLVGYLAIDFIYRSECFPFEECFSAVCLYKLYKWFFYN
ncbi:hypothetical protein CWI38_0681p0010 [Hamiltosporidium tvaerminnensis]|uniref:Uncharacterized protein n=2 Tax=Hamiltosporidium tvaerminnensis TaxID=1176355 RepID=A0A4Q9LVC9_9MICR|nr:hypothetical protein CWI38_0681p0010 [Hamiltosporidium tvaerminnensis]